MEDVKVRFRSALVATVLSVICFYYGDPLITMWWVVVHMLMVKELLTILDISFLSGVVSYGISQLLFLELTFAFPFSLQHDTLLAILFIPFMVAVLDPYGDFKMTCVVTTSYLWITYPCTIGVSLSSRPSFIVSLLCIVWFTDAGAYFCGKLFGRTPLLSRISPKKTVEGTLGALVVAQIVAYIASLYVTDIEPITWAWIALIGSITGQIGDLFESMLKRSWAVKDAGQIMPGHGGMLDRFDAILFALIFVKAYLTLMKIAL